MDPREFHAADTARRRGWAGVRFFLRSGTSRAAKVKHPNDAIRCAYSQREALSVLRTGVWMDGGCVVGRWEY